MRSYTLRDFAEMLEITGFDGVICGDSMIAEIWCGAHFLNFAELI